MPTLLGLSVCLSVRLSVGRCVGLWKKILKIVENEVL